jgi:hypothetical protein
MKPPRSNYLPMKKMLPKHRISVHFNRHEHKEQKADGGKAKTTASAVGAACL